MSTYFSGLPQIRQRLSKQADLYQTQSMINRSENGRGILDATEIQSRTFDFRYRFDVKSYVSDGMC